MSAGNNKNIVQNSLPSSLGDNMRFFMVPAGDDYYQIKNALGKCIRSPYNTNKSSAVSYSCYSNWSTEKYKKIPTSGGFFRLKNKYTGKCLRVIDGSKNNNARLVQDLCSSWSSNQFKLE